MHGGLDAKVIGNVIEGTQQSRRDDPVGACIHVWNSPGALVDGNAVRWGRDGIFANASKKNTFRNNTFRDLRFAVH